MCSLRGWGWRGRVWRVGGSRFWLVFSVSGLSHLLFISLPSFLSSLLLLLSRASLSSSLPFPFPSHRIYTSPFPPSFAPPPASVFFFSCTSPHRSVLSLFLSYQISHLPNQISTLSALQRIHRHPFNLCPVRLPAHARSVRLLESFAEVVPRCDGLVLRWSRL